MTYLTGNAAARCGANPFRRPAETWQVVKEAKRGDSTAKQVVASRTDAYSKYNSWFQKTFGVSSESVAMGAEEICHALVGPLPPSVEERLPHKGFAGATVLLSAADHVFFAASTSDYESKHAELVAKQATQLAGGDLSALDGS